MGNRRANMELISLKRDWIADWALILDEAILDP